MTSVVTPLKCGKKGLGLFFRKDCQKGEVVVDHTFPLIHLVNHSCQPSCVWQADSNGGSWEGLTEGRVGSPAFVVECQAIDASVLMKIMKSFGLDDVGRV